jgi:GAF domain-containing protein
VRVCVPLYAADRLLGLVLIFGFLPQKAEFSQIDHELFSLVGTHAATALYCAELHSSRGRAA